MRAVIGRKRPWTPTDEEREPLIGKALRKKYGFAMRLPQGTLVVEYAIAGISRSDGGVREISPLSTPFA